MKKSYEIDMCNGPLVGKILLFTLPLILSGILQLLFNAADTVVVGRFSGPNALAAVGSTGALINLITNVFIGLSIGTNVLTAQGYGAGDERSVSDTVHTSILLSLVSGVFLIFVGVGLAMPVLRLMGTPEEVVGQATLYMKIFFVGMPAMMLYNFGAAILRAIGDTRRPLYFLIVAGIINVILNLFFVIVLHMGVAGVATATVVSQVISAVLVTRCLIMMDGMCHLDLKKLSLNPKKLLMIARIGLPAGLQGALFSISNVLIQSSINSFGATAMAGNTAAGNLEGFVYISMNSVHQTGLSFTSQNMGAGNHKRVRKVMLICLAFVTCVGLLLGNGFYLMARPLLGIYSADAEVIQYGVDRMAVICVTYCLCGIMDVLVGVLRGMGCSFIPMIVSLIGVCGFRVVWIFSIFQWNHTLHTLYLSYPISWITTSLAHLTCWFVVMRKIESRRAVNELPK